MKKKYEAAKAEVVRLETKDIITLSGFFGSEVSFKSKGGNSTKEVTLDWSTSFGEEK